MGKGRSTVEEIPLSSQTLEMLKALAQQQMLLQNQIQLILQTVVSCQDAEGKWAMSPCGTKLIKQEEPK